jgi:NADH-quinone oxidoreductase subunit L
VTDWLGKFLEPTFVDSAFKGQAPSTGAEWLGLVIGAVVSAAGIAGAWFAYRRRPGLTADLIQRFPGPHRFLERRWYFDEAYELAVVRPIQGLATFSRRVIEGGFVQGVLVGGATGIVRGGTAVARTIQSGYLRAYALLLVTGLFAVAVDFLTQSS